MTNECPHCNTHNPPQAVTCRVCNLTLPRSNPSPLVAGRTLPKLAVFDLDKTVFDLSRRERAARRQGIKPKSKKWYEFLNQNKYVLMDTPIPGTAAFIRALSESGYTIAYVSGRPNSILAATKQSLQESGFPIDALDRDLVFLHSGGKPSLANLTKHKKSVLTHLKSIFDIHFFFDDTPEFREAAKSLFIPGVYSSVASYTGKEERTSDPKKSRSKKAKKNPQHSELLPIMSGEPTGRHKKLGAVFSEVFIGRNVVKDVGEVVQGIYRGLVGGRTSMAEKRMAMAIATMQKELSDRAKELGGNAVANLKLDYEMVQGTASLTIIGTADAVVTYDKVKPNPHSSGANCGCGKTPCITYGGGEVKLNPPPMPRKKRDKAGNMRKEPIKKYTERFMGDKKMNEEFPDRGQRFAVALSYARKFYSDAAVDKAYPRDNPGSNPHTPVHEAKTMYKQFHQKPAKNVKKTKVDIGDTWVGLGKAWSIGYRSGKETGNESQKYIHNFGVDEESGKKFKEPELYYVKNNDGSQMMVIMGGDWYIDVAEDGSMSWIYI